jgi:hypothetical protein
LKELRRNKAGAKIHEKAKSESPELSPVKSWPVTNLASTQEVRRLSFVRVEPERRNLSAQGGSMDS